MKFKNIDGIQYVIMEANDEVHITTPEELEKKSITIQNNKEGLDISGNSSIINSIKGEGMLDRIYLPPVVSSEEIIAKCDTWIDMFKHVHDAFKELVTTDKYEEQDIVIRLDFSDYFNSDDKKGKCIDLDLKKLGKIIKEGVTIQIDEVNRDVFAYIAASVLDYFISQDCKEQEIDLLDFNGIISSKDHNSKKPHIMANITTIIEDRIYYDIVATIIANHNLGDSSEQLIFNLRNKISNQQISDRIDKDINHSANQYAQIVKK